MNLQETNKIVEAVAAIDNRQVTVERVKAWHEVLAKFDYWECREALIECRQDAGINYLEPKHIIAKVMTVRERKEQELRRERAQTEAAPIVSTPMPTCKHGRGLLTCDPCCRDMAIQAGLIKG